MLKYNRRTQNISQVAVTKGSLSTHDVKYSTEDIGEIYNRTRNGYRNILSDPLDHLLLAGGGHDLVKHSLLGSP